MSGREVHDMTPRFLKLSRYARDCGADAILFTCSAFGPCIDICSSDLAPLLILRPNEAMIEEAASFRRVGLLASFRPTLNTMPREFSLAAPGVTIVPCYAAGALAALDKGDVLGHDHAASTAAVDLQGQCDVIACAQFSLSRAANAIYISTGLPVITTPGSAVRKLKRLLGH